MKLEDIFAVYKKNEQEGVVLLEEYLKINLTDFKVVYTLFAYYVKNKNYVKAAHYLDLLYQTDINMSDYYTYLFLINDLLDLNLNLSHISMNDLLISKGNKKFDDVKGNNAVRMSIYNGAFFSAKIRNSKVFHKKNDATLEESIITDLINANVNKKINEILSVVENGAYEDALDILNSMGETELEDALTILDLQTIGMPLRKEHIEELESTKKIDSRIASTFLSQARIEDSINKTLYYQNETDYFYLYIEQMNEFYEDEQVMQSLVRDYLTDYSKMEYYAFIMKIYEKLSKDVFFDYIYTILYGVDRSYLVRKYEETNDETYNEIMALIPVIEKEDIIKKIEKLLS